MDKPKVKACRKKNGCTRSESWELMQGKTFELSSAEKLEEAKKAA